VTTSSSDEATKGAGSRHFVAMALVAMIGTAALYLALERARYAELLPPEHLGLTRDEAVLLPWTIWSKTLLLLVPPLLAGGALAGAGARRLGYGLFLSGSTLAFTFVALDLKAYEASGRHVLELLRFAAMRDGAQAGGSPGQWAWLVIRWLCVSGAATLLVGLASRRLIFRVGSSVSPGMWRALSVTLGLGIFVAALAPNAAAASWRDRNVLERLYGALPFDVRLEASKHPTYDDPAWARLESGFRKAYASAFPLLFAPRARQDAPLGVPGARPNVVLVIVESLRADAFTEERMPRLFRWAKGGLVAHRHYAGSDYSEAGMFTLVYGRSALLYHSLLDARVPPTLCALGHRLGYECGYYSGQPSVWLRMEDFINPRTIDHFVHDDTGDWTEWDRRALANVVRALHREGAKPEMALVQLMSTHFEYQYPKEYERHLPVARDSKWAVTALTALGEDARIPHWNRYLNSLAFTDDLVADAIEALDPQQNIVIVTGDHGESLYDDHHYGHGYSFADVIARVPFAMVGPGVPAGTLDDLSLHEDVLATLLQAITGSTDTPFSTDGRSLLSSHPPRHGALLAHCSFDQDVADALFVHDDLRVRLELGLRGPEVSLRGFEDALGAPRHGPPLTLAQADELVRAFATELDRIRR